MLVSCGHSVRAFTVDGHEVPLPTDALYDHSAPTAIRWFPNGRLLAVGTESGKFAFHHHEHLNAVGYLEPDSDDRSMCAVQCIDVTNGSRFLAAGSDNGELNIWDMKTRTLANSFSTSATIHAVAFQRTADSRYVACACASDVLLYSRASGRLVDCFTVSTTKPTSPTTPSDDDSKPYLELRAPTLSVKVTAIAFSPHNLNLLAVTDDSGCLNVWDISRTHSARMNKTSQKPAKIDINSTYSRFSSPLRTPATDVAFAPHCSTVGLYVGGLDKHIRLYDKTLKRLLFSITCSAPIASVTCSADDVHVAAGLTTGDVAIFEVDTITKEGILVTLLKDVHNAPSGRLNSKLSSSVRSLHFQPQVALNPDSASSETPRFPQDKRNRGVQDIASFTSPYSRERWGNRLRERAKTTPPRDMSATPSKAHTPRRALDDENATRHHPRDSDIFSPIVTRSREVENTASGVDALGRPDDTRYRVGAPFSANSPVPSRMPHINDRRMSDLIPAQTPVGLKYRNFQETSAPPDAQDMEQQFDGDDIDALLSQSPSGSFDGAGVQVKVISKGQELGRITTERSRDVGDLDTQARRVRSLEDIPSGNLDSNKQPKGTTLPRGMAFRRLRKTASEVSPRKQLPPRPPPRSKTQETGSEFVPQTQELSAHDTYHATIPGQTDETTQARADNEVTRLATSDVVDEEQSFQSVDTENASNNTSGSQQTRALQMGPAFDAGNANAGSPSDLNKTIKRTIVEEMDAVRQDIRSDLLNIHTEIVLASSRQGEEIKKLFLERDKIIDSMRAELAELREQNRTLIQMYSKR